MTTDPFKYLERPCPECGHTLGAIDSLIMFTLKLIPPKQVLKILTEAEKESRYICPRCKVEVKHGQLFCAECYTRFGDW